MTDNETADKIEKARAANRNYIKQKQKCSFGDWVRECKRRRENGQKRHREVSELNRFRDDPE